MKKLSEYLKVSVTLALVCGVVTLLLSYVYSVTNPIITKRNEEKATKLCREVLDSENFQVVSVPDGMENIAMIYKASEGGWVFAATGNGYGGALTVMVGVRDGAVTGTAVLSSSETEGIGTKVQDSSFSDRFKGVKSEGVSSVDVIAGATRSSNAYKNAVKSALSAYEEMEAAK
jgi:electron transport complex protein RnfG